MRHRSPRHPRPSTLARWLRRSVPPLRTRRPERRRPRATPRTRARKNPPLQNRPRRPRPTENPPLRHDAPRTLRRARRHRLDQSRRPRRRTALARHRPVRFRLGKQRRLPSCGWLCEQRPVKPKQRTETVVLRLESGDLSERTSETMAVSAHGASLWLVAGSAWHQSGSQRTGASTVRLCVVGPELAKTG